MGLTTWPKSVFMSGPLARRLSTPVENVTQTNFAERLKMVGDVSVRGQSQDQLLERVKQELHHLLNELNASVMKKEKFEISLL